MSNLTFHYQLIRHNNDSIFIHEAFSTRLGEIYMIDPLPVEVNGETEEEVTMLLEIMETDSAKYKPIAINSVITQMERWVDEVDSKYEFVEPLYEDELDLEEDYLDESGEVIDLVSYIERNK